MIIKGKPIDNETRCIHYSSARDVVAIKFKCCNEYYPCYVCHEETAGHRPEVWKQNEFNTKAILCGVCQTEMTISIYKDFNYKCPACKALFNAHCRNHDHLYFEQ